MKILVKKQPLNEMASKVAAKPYTSVEFNNLDLEMIIFVNDSERNHLPHMHIQVRPRCEWGTNSEPIFETCVRIDVAEYSLHSNKFKKFPSTEWRDLFVELISGYINRKYGDEIFKIPCWDDTVNKWEDSLSANYNIPENCKMPNYKSLDIDNSVMSIINSRLAKIRDN